MCVCDCVGNIGVAKCALSEITDSTNSATAFSRVCVMIGIGSVIGPLMGGFLSDPARSYPSLFGDVQFFITYPYCLPCICCGIIGLITGFFAWYQLEETCPNVLRARKARDAQAAAEVQSLLDRAAESKVKSYSSDEPVELKPPPTPERTYTLREVFDRSVSLCICGYALGGFGQSMYDEVCQSTCCVAFALLTHACCLHVL
jgi:MFS family permease